MVTILKMPVKIAVPAILKIKLFWKQGYDVINFVYDITRKILLRDSIYIVGAIMWPKFGNSLPQFYKDLTRKTAFIEKQS